MQKELVSLGVGVRKISLNPSMLTPFLDEKDSDEAALKEFLHSVHEVNIFSLPSRDVLDGIAKRALNAAYVQEMDLTQGNHRMWVYIHPAEGEHVTNLVLLLQEPNSVFYSIAMSGRVDNYTLANLSHISPAFFDSYINRFNVKF